MAPADLIEITSSDSENETEVGPKEKTSVPLRSTPSVHRQLPAWATTSTSNSKSYHGSAEKLPFRGPASGSAERLIDLNNHSQAKPLLHSSSSNTGMLADQHIDDPKYLSKDWNMGQSRELSSQQSLRMLPPSFHSSPSTSKPKASYENGAGSQIPISHSIDHSMGTARFDHKDYGGDHLGAQQNDEVLMYGHGRSRVLPPSLMHGKSHTNPTHHASSSDPGHHSTDGELPTENDERVIYQAALQDLSQPKVEASLPDGLLTVPLLKHQKIALAWMVQKETKSVHCLGGILADDQGLGKTVSMIALIQMQRHLQSKPSTNGAQAIKPEALNLDDDDDDGVIELEKGKMIAESDEPKKVQEVSTATPVFSKGRPAAGTLVVCPASIVRQWARELDDKVTDSAKLSVLIYHGGSRTKDPIELAKYDVVLTTYAIVTNEVPKQPIVEDDDEDPKNGERFGISSELSVNKKRKKVANAGKKGRKGKMGTNGSIECNSGPLARVGWFRVILDEAQTIKNHRTQVARACSSLRAKRRWCLSGTPIQNTIDDLFSYFRFLKYDPYSAYKSFCSSIKYPISRNAAHGYKKLQAVLKTVMLRRTKGTLLNGEPIINIPPKSVNLSKVEFSIDERAFYSKLEADSRSQFKAYAAAGTVNQNYANILLMLLRLRQACDHPFLVKGYHSPSAGEGSLEIAKQLPKEMRINLLNHLEDSMAICGVCSDPPENAVVTMCGHVFCYQCVSEYLTGDDNLCPAPRCKDQIGADVVFSKAILGRSISDELGGYGTSASDVGDSSVVHQDMYSSSKIKAALQVLQTQCIQKCSSITQGVEGCNLTSYTEAKISENGECDMNAATHLAEPKQSQMEGPLKAIVFSQWTSMLDLVETSLNINCIQYRRLDGTMSLPARDRAVKEFNSDPEVVVMLMSLKAGNLGLNMVAACHVILLDIWWNPTTEDQAVDRAHRIGQTRPVTVTRLTIKDTVEDRILALQEEKRKMVAAAFGEDPTGGPGTRLTVEDLRYLFMV